MKNVPPVMKSEIPMGSAHPAAGRRASQDNLPPVGGDARDLPASGAQRDSSEPFQRMLQKSLQNQERGRNRDGSSAADRSGAEQESAPARAAQADEEAALRGAGRAPRTGGETVSAPAAGGAEREEITTQSRGKDSGEETAVLLPPGGPLVVREYRNLTPEAPPAEGGRPERRGRGTTQGKAAAQPGSPAVDRDPRTTADPGQATLLSGTPVGAAADAAVRGAKADATRISASRGTGHDAPERAEAIGSTRKGSLGASPGAETNARMTGSAATGGAEGAVEARVGRARGAVMAEAVMADKGGRNAAALAHAASPPGDRKMGIAHPGAGGRGENPAQEERGAVAGTAETVPGHRRGMGAETRLGVHRTGSGAQAEPVEPAGDPRLVVRSSDAGQGGKSTGIADSLSPAPAGTDRREALRRPPTTERPAPAPTSAAPTADAAPGGGLSDAAEAPVAGQGHEASLAAEGPVRLHLRQPRRGASAAGEGMHPGEQGTAVKAGNQAPEAAENSGAVRARQGGDPRPENGGKNPSSGSPFGTLPAGRLHRNPAVDPVSPSPNAFAAAVADASALRPGSDALGESAAAGGPTSLLQQVVEASQPVLQQGGGRVLISLNPPNLGTLDIDVRVRRDTVELFVVATNPDVQQTLYSHVEQLRKALVDQGLNMDRFQVVVEDRSGSPQGGDPRQEGMAGWHGEARGERGYRREAAAEAAGDVARAAVRSDAHQSSLGGINVFI